jgi:L-asparaginase
LLSNQNGKIAAATSTGGKGFEVPGRISDSTVAGNYANPFCGVSLTGGRGYYE